MADQTMTIPTGETNYLLPITINASGNRSFTLKTVNKFLDTNIDITTTTPAGQLNTALSSLPSGASSSGTITRGNYIKIGAGYYNEDLYYRAATNSSGTLVLDTSDSAQTNISSDGYSAVKVEGINVPVDKTFALTITADSALDDTSNISITNGAYRRINLTNVANGTLAVTNQGNTSVTSNSTSAGTLSVSAYPSSGSTIETSKTIVSGGRWVCTPTFNGAGTYYGKVTVAAVNASLGGSTTTSGKASAAIAATNYTGTGTSNLNCSSTTPASGTAGQDYWQVKATASITTTPKFTPSLTLTTAGWMASAPTGSATNVTVNGDSTGQSLYIPKATFSVDGNVVYCNTAGYIPAGNADNGVGTIGTGTITPNASLPSGTNAESTIINRGGYIKIGSGYYGSDIYYQAQSNSGNKDITTSNNAQVTIDCDGYATVTVKGITVGSGKAFSLTMAQGSSGNETDTNSMLTLTNNRYRRVNASNKGNIYITHGTSGQGKVFISAYNESTQQQIINNGAWVTTNANTSGAGTYYGKVTLAAGTMSAVTSEPSSTDFPTRPSITIASGGWLQMTAGYYPATAISLATLVPDAANIPYSTQSPYILSGKTAYDVNGALITGGIGTYGGLYEETTPGGS